MSFNDRIESLLEEYQRQRNSLTEMQQKMRELSASVTSPRREVTVTVGQNGVVTDIRFPTGAYKRLTPADLTTVILETYAEAKEQVLAQATAILAPMLPDGVDAGALVRGTAGTDAYLPAEPRMATSVREILGMGRPAQ
ncbi:YbaB/EbfC family nucleoid-associated protein [Micromonospora sp. NBC_00858]|uniref:YbaB/EbfC family nucleoid-associated protein n=1 Tax=Micromonospora sp. NBC_00858 TaxID=2975979 RepID=UPI0038647B12|nr:YbaB/EbfC family nucleoid-associated protein [Micromonospora sp. NBC_00858]